MIVFTFIKELIKHIFITIKENKYIWIKEETYRIKIDHCRKIGILKEYLYLLKKLTNKEDRLSSIIKREASHILYDLTAIYPDTSLSNIIRGIEEYLDGNKNNYIISGNSVKIRNIK